MTARERGFSLVETLVAMAIIAVMTGVFFQVIATDAHSARHLAQRRAAVLLAQSLLAQAALPRGPTGSAERGVWHGLVWQVQHRRPVEQARDTGPQLDEVRVAVADAGGRRLADVRTLRLAE